MAPYTTAYAATTHDSDIFHCAQTGWLDGRLRQRFFAPPQPVFEASQLRPSCRERGVDEREGEEGHEQGSEELAVDGSRVGGEDGWRLMEGPPPQHREVDDRHHRHG